MAPDGLSLPFSKELTLALSRRQNLKGVILKKKGFISERFKLLAGRIPGGGGGEQQGPPGLRGALASALRPRSSRNLEGPAGGISAKTMTVSPRAPPANLKRIEVVNDCELFSEQVL